MKISTMDAARLALVAGAVVAGVYAVRKLGQVGSAAVDKAGELAGRAAEAVNPLNPDNVFSATVNDVGAVLVAEPDGAGKNADGSWSFGGWLYDVTHGGPVQP